MMRKCILCRKDFYPSQIDSSYFERGISKKEFLCKECYDKKVLICDYSENEGKRNEAIKEIRDLMEDKVPIVREIVNGWIDGEEKNYYGGVREYLYHISGPEATMFVFSDHVTILSEKCRMGNRDYLIFYKHVPYKAVYGGYSGDKHIFDISDCVMSDKDKINGMINDEQLGDCGAIRFESIALNFSLGEYGILNFGDRSFKFYYHQNQIMEEVYNYIQQRMANPEAEEDEIVQNTNDSPSVLSKQIEKKTEEDKESFSLADEIVKLKGLLDCGILSQEEFDRAKNKLIDKL